MRRPLQAAADARPALVLHRRQRRRHRLRLLRQDGHGPRHHRRHRPDGRRGARRAVQGRQGLHGRHRHQRAPGRRLRLDRHPARRQADADGRGRSAPRAGRHGGPEARRAGRPAHRGRRRGPGEERPGEEGVLCRTDRRALFQRPARVEQAVRQHALRARQGAAEEAERVQDRRQADQARGHRAEGVRAGGLRHRRQGAGHGACADDPAAGRRQRPGQGRRKLDQGHPQRQGGVAGRLPRRRRRQGVGRHPGDAEPQGGVVAGQAAVPAPGLALRRHPQVATCASAWSRRTSAMSTTPSRPRRG